MEGTQDNIIGQIMQSITRTSWTRVLLGYTTINTINTGQTNVSKLNIIEN